MPMTHKLVTNDCVKLVPDLKVADLLRFGAKERDLKSMKLMNMQIKIYKDLFEIMLGHFGKTSASLLSKWDAN